MYTLNVTIRCASQWSVQLKGNVDQLCVTTLLQPLRGTAPQPEIEYVFVAFIAISKKKSTHFLKYNKHSEEYR